MKVIISGGTGYIGGNVLTKCLQHPSITSVLILSRRALQGDIFQHAKAKVIIVSDFTAYETATMTELKTADAVIWCLGTYNGDERVDIDFPLAFIHAIKTARSTSGSQKFRHIQLGGAFTEPPVKKGETERSLWYFANGRRVRGAAEAKVLAESDTAEENNGYEVHIVKPGGVLNMTGASWVQCVLGQSLSITMDDLTTTMVDLAVSGNEQTVLLNRDIIRHARSLSTVSG